MVAVAVFVATLFASATSPVQGPGSTTVFAGASEAKLVVPEGIDNAVIAGKTAYLLQKQSVAYSGKVLEKEWRSDGRRLLIVGETPNNEKAFRTGAELLVYDRVADRTRSLWKSSVPGNFISNPHWLGNSSKFVAQVSADNERTVIVAGDAEGGAIREVFRSDQPQIAIIGNANAPYLLIAGFDTSTASLGVDIAYLDSTLTAKPLTRLPPTTGVPEWSPDGKLLMVTSYAPDQLQSGQIERGTYAMDPKTGKLTKIGGMGFDAPNSTPLAVLGSATSVQSEREPDELNQPRTNTSKKGMFQGSWDLKGLVLTSAAEDQRRDNMGLITADGSEALLAPDLSGVAFESQGVLFVRSIAQMDSASFLQVRNAYEKQKAMEIGKLMALGMTMYSLDMDEVFPPNKGWSDAVKPYLRDEKMMNGFNYTFGGGAISDDKKSTTELGFSQGPGGRAVAYADGHVEWVPDK